MAVPHSHLSAVPTPLFDNMAAACLLHLPIVEGLIFCISATPHLGSSFPLFHGSDHLFAALTLSLPSSLSLTEDGLDFEGLYNKTLCGEEIGDKLVQCVHSVNEAFVNSSIYSETETKPFYMYNTFGYSLKPPVLNEWKDDFFQVNLDPDLSYMVDMTDPKLQLALGKPGIIPRTIFSLKPSDGFLGIYFKVIN